MGLYNLVQGVLGELINGGTYIGGGGGGISGMKKSFEMSHSSVDGNAFLIC